MNKTYALRIKVQPKYKQASVLGYRFDVDTISKVEDQLLGDENTSKMENNQSPINNQITAAPSADGSGSDSSAATPPLSSMRNANSLAG